MKKQIKSISQILLCGILIISTVLSAFAEPVTATENSGAGVSGEVETAVPSETDRGSGRNGSTPDNGAASSGIENITEYRSDTMAESDTKTDTGADIGGDADTGAGIGEDINGETDTGIDIGTAINGVADTGTHVDGEADTDIDTNTDIHMQTFSEVTPGTGGDNDPEMDMETVDPLEDSSVPSDETATEPEMEPEEGAYMVDVQTDFRGMELSIDGKQSIRADAGNRIEVMVSGSARGNYFFDGVRAVTENETYIDLDYDEATGHYYFQMPEANVYVRAGFCRILILDTIGATQHTVTSYESNAYTYPSGIALVVGQFVIDGLYDAFCCDHVKNPPQAGTVLTVQEEWSDNSTYTSTLIRRIAYYGYHGGGAGEAMAHFNLSEDWLQRYTSLAFSVACGNDDSAMGYGTAFIDWVSGMPNAPDGLVVYRMSVDNDPYEYDQDLVYWTYKPMGYLTMHKEVIVHERHDAQTVFSPEGAEYTLYSDAGCTNAVGQYTLRADGYANEVLELTPGTYYLKETKAPSCGLVAMDPGIHEVYVYDSNGSHTTSMDNPIVMNVQDDGYTGYLKIHKTVTGGEIRPEGAVYKVYTDEACTHSIASLTIGSSGASETMAFAVGRYWVREESAPEGLELDVAVYPVQVTAAHTSEQPVVVNSVDVVSHGYLQLLKASADPGLTDGNSCYSLAGAVYGIYMDPDCNVSSKVLEVVTDANGKSNAVKLNVGTYYVKELTSSAGYILDPAVYTAVVTKDHTSAMALTLNVSETPQNNPVSVILAKYDGEKTYDAAGNLPQGGASLAGAEFTVKFYAGDYHTGNLPETATRTWVVRTDANGCAYLTEDYMVSGDPLYYSSKGDITLPLGTVTVQETKAPEGYVIHKELYLMKITASGSTESVTAYNAPIVPEIVMRGGVQIRKVDADTGETVAQGNASLSGAVYTIVNQNDHAVSVNGISYDKGKAVLTLTTDSKGMAQTAADALPYGTYSIVETDPSTGYGINSTSIDFSITKLGQIVSLEKPMEEPIICGGVKIQKYDSDTLTTQPQGDATLGGMVFAITNQSAASVHVDGKLYKPGDTVATLTADATGLAQTSADLLPYGTYKISELTPPMGYTVQGTVERIFSITEDGAVIDLTDAGHGIINDIIRGGVRIQKRDHETKDILALGGASLAGAVFEIINVSQASVVVEGTLYGPGETVATLVTDTDGIAQTTEYLLPYGTYKITETTPPPGYTDQGMMEQTFSVREDGKVVDLTGADQSIYNQVIRGDFEITKIDSEDQTAMAGVSFRLTSMTTGESHTFTTDSNGHYSSSSSWNKHSTNTNGGGPEDGLWFGWDRKGSRVPVNDDLGALPYDIYKLEELPGVANAGKVLYSGTLTIRRDNYTVDMGNVENKDEKSPEIATSARTDQGDAYAPAEDGVTVIDTVTYADLTRGQTYVLVAELMDRATGEPVTDRAGNAIRAEGEFICLSESGSIDVKISFDASDMAGMDVVVFETLYARSTDTDQELEWVAEHKDINDMEQTIHFPKIQTTAIDSKTGMNISKADEEITIVDRVAYTNLPIGRRHMLYGSLFDKATGEPVLDDSGKAVTAQTAFVPDTEDGAVDVIFTVNGVDLAGRTLVVFEELYRGSVIYATHTDLQSETQSIYIPEIKTTATDLETGDHIGHAGGTVTIQDIVGYSNLPLGKLYTVSGTLMVKSTGKPLLISGQEVTASASFTATEPEGSVTLTFTVPGKVLAGETVVAFESIRCNNVEVAAHADIGSEDQSVYYPKIRTTAVSGHSGNHYAYADKTVILKDTVTYTSLMPQKEYILKGVVIDAATGEPLMDAGGAEVTAETVFVPESPDGEAEVEFSFDASKLAGQRVVVFESLYLVSEAGDKDQLVAEHKDISDEGQTIRFPSLVTTAVDADTQANLTGADSDITIRDLVQYTQLEVGCVYTVSGSLKNKATGEPVIDANGNEVRAETVFTPETEDGSVDVVFNFDGNHLAGETLVIYETLTREGVIYATHTDIDSEPQTVYIPEIRTTAMDVSTGNSVGAVNSMAEIIDTVYYKNVVAGKTYTLTGSLMDAATGEALTDIHGTAITGETTFMAESSEGRVDVQFTLDSNALAGKTIVVFETLSYDGVAIATHMDIQDKEQSIAYPDIRTMATDMLTGEHQGFVTETVTVQDVVAYKNLIPQRSYVLKGILMDKATGQPFLDAYGDEVRSETEFVPESENGSVTMTFTFDGRCLKDTELVAFESLLSEDVEVISHADMEDEGQTVRYPTVELRTNASDGISGTHQGYAEGTVTLRDEVSYKNLIAGRTYTVTGILMDKETGEPYLVNGESITAEKIFTADAADGTVDLEFTFSSDGLKGHSLVAFEFISYEGNEIGVHADIHDADQTVVYPEIYMGTVAVDDLTGLPKGIVRENTVITDTVTIKGMEIGQSYTLKGTLMDKATGEPYRDVHGNEVTAEDVYTAKATEEVRTMVFSLDGSDLAGKTLVVFEALYYGGLQVAGHEDLSSVSQTVTYPEVKLKTAATDKVSGTQKAVAGREVRIIDQIAYEGLIVGQTYKVYGKVYDKSTGEPLVMNGEEVTAELVFIAESEDGSIDTTFVFDGSQLADKTLVVFEYLYYVTSTGDTVEVARHANLNSADQSVTVIAPPVPESPSRPVKTGDDMETGPIAVVALFSLIVVIGICICYIFKKRKKK